MVLFVGQTFEGCWHDYVILKEEFPPDLPWFELVTVLAVLGFQGILSDYEGERIFIPFGEESGKTAHIERQTIRYVRDAPVWSEKRFLSAKTKRCTKNVYEYLSIIIILNYQFEKTLPFLY